MLKARSAVPILLPPFLLSILLLPLAASSAAQAVDTVDISACRAIVDRLQRFDCYESLEAAEVAAPVGEAPRPNPVAAEPPPVAAPLVVQPAPAAAPAAPAPGVETFGRGAETARVREIEGGEGATELTDTVAVIERRLPNRALVTLSSGQKWMQMLDKRYPLRVGDEVRIYPTQWGNAYRLTATRLSGYIQVQRVD